MVATMASRPNKAIAQAVANKLDPPPLGKRIDQLDAIRERKRAADKVVSEIEAEYDVLAASIMETMEADGMAKATGSKASVSITMSDVGNVTDWSAAEAWMVKNKCLHLFQRRLNDAALRELWEKGKKPAGIETFTKKRLGLRSVT